MDPKAKAEAVLGSVDWVGPTEGYCRCPGVRHHTTAGGEKDCRVRIDGAPTVYCFHTHCEQEVAEANRQLRRELGAQPWELRLPNGRVLRSGESYRVAMSGRRTDAVVQAVRAGMEEKAGEILEELDWPFEQMLAESPLAVAHRDPTEQFRLWLRLWPADATLWIGDVFDSGKEEHRGHFRPVADWYQVGPVMGNFTCASRFRPGAWARTDENVERREFLVVESDALTRDEVGAVFQFMRRELNYELRCIVDTGGKSLHAWFSPPPDGLLEGRLKAALQALNCDPKMFGRAQPVRVPGAMRGERLQRLVWINV